MVRYVVTVWGLVAIALAVAVCALVWYWVAHRIAKYRRLRELETLNRMANRPDKPLP